MKVHELIETLKRLDPNAEVFLGVQPNYPFEHRIAGVAQRGDWLGEGRNEGANTDVGDRWTAREDELRLNDVLILDGGQVRYGNRAAWDAAR